MTTKRKDNYRILHLPKYPARQGGMDELLRLHAANQESIYGLLCHKNFRSVGFRTKIPFFLQHSALRRIKQLSTDHDVTIYYNCWGADLFSSHDKASLRIGYIHNHFPKFEEYIKHYAKFLDGFLTVNPVTNIQIRRLLKDSHPEQNIQTIPLPINPPIKMPKATRKNIVGLVGRVIYEQKRFDRLPEFASLLKQKFPEIKVEILGDGPLKNQISAALKHNKQVAFLPWTEGLDYWKTLARWKYILFLSDYEGLPISLLEALYAGCTPIYPDFHDGHRQGLPLLLYPIGDMNAAVNSLQIEPRLPSTPDTFTTTQDYLRSFTKSLSKISANEKSTIPLVLSSQTMSYNRRYKKLNGSAPKS